MFNRINFDKIMEKFNVVKQPDGKYSIFLEDSVYKYNINNADLFSELEKSIAEQIREYLYSPTFMIHEVSFEDAIARDFSISNGYLQKIGVEKDIVDIRRCIPRVPNNIEYDSYKQKFIAMCPSCRADVVDTPSHRDKTCPRCSQAIRWEFSSQK